MCIRPFVDPMEIWNNVKVIVQLLKSETRKSYGQTFEDLCQWQLS